MSFIDLPDLDVRVFDAGQTDTLVVNLTTLAFANRLAANGARGCGVLVVEVVDTLASHCSRSFRVLFLLLLYNSMEDVIVKCFLKNYLLSRIFHSLISVSTISALLESDGVKS